MIRKKESKFLRGLKSAAQWGYRLIVVATSIAVYFEPICASLAVTTAVCSGISSTFKDKTNTKFNKLNKVADGFKVVANALAMNFGKASNDPNIN